MFNEDQMGLTPLEQIQLHAATTPVDAHRFSSVVRLIRPEQWVKNVFVLAPLLFTPAAISAASLHSVGLALVSFCALSSAVYVLNDYVDREVDRCHPLKRHRPLADGSVTVQAALLVFGVLLGTGLGVASVLQSDFLLIAVGYVGLNFAYSLGLKHISLVDVMLVALGFILRVEAGASAVAITPSAWIIVITGLLSLFLVLAKRRDDLDCRLDGNHRKSLDGYTAQFLDIAVSIILGALLVAYLIYSTNEEVMTRLGTRHVYYTVPFVVFGILRYLQMMVVEQRTGSPATIVLTDRGVIIAVVGWIGTFLLLLYT